MKAQPLARTGQARQPAASHSAIVEKATGESAFVDQRPEAIAQLKLADAIDKSPYMVAQRMRLGSKLGKAAQLGGGSGELRLAQGKFPPGPQRGPENEGTLQGKFAAVQRKDPEAAWHYQHHAKPDAPPAQLQSESATARNNTGLPDNLKSGIESLSGLSLDSVQVHYNSSQPARLNALAYAQGNNIHVAPGRERHLPHEAWHVVQQAQGRVQPTMQMKDGVPVNDDEGLEREADVMGAKALQRRGQPLPRGFGEAGSAVDVQPETAATEAGAHAPIAALQRQTGVGVVQRDVGFEFESPYLNSRKTLTGVALLPGLHHRPLGLGLNAWDNQLKAASKRLVKGPADEFLTHAHFGVQGDDQGASTSDAEIVTDHFPETAAGRLDLVAALAAMVAMEGRLEAIGTNQAPLASDLAGGGVNSVRNDVFLMPNNFAPGFYGGPQITTALALGNVRTMTRDLLYDPHETGAEELLRRPGRAITRGLDPGTGASRAPGGASAAAGLIRGMERADEAVHAYQVNHPTAPASEALKGLLTLIFSITETVQIGGVSNFLKSASDLLPKTDFATMFATLPEHAYYSRQDPQGGVRFVDLVGSAPGYRARMRRPLFDVPPNRLLDEMAGGGRAWYRALTLKDWARGMTVSDNSGWNRVRDTLFGQRSVDRLTTANFPRRPQNRTVEGFGTLGAHQDPLPGFAAAPVMEIRFPSRRMKVAQFAPAALKLFDYLSSVRQGAPARIV